MRILLIAAMLAVLAVIAVTDWRTKEIPDGLVIVILLLSLVSCRFFPEVTVTDRVIGLFAVSLPMAVVIFFVPGAFGGGDIKFMAALGIGLGWKLTLLTFVGGVLTGGIYAGYLLLVKKRGRTDSFAFGPFLCMGAAIALFVGNDLIHWYLG